MAELEWRGSVEPGSLRRAVRHALRRFQPGWRVVAEGFLGATSPIDLLAIGDDGEPICVRVSTDAQGGDGGARLLAQAISDLGWLAPRIADLHALAPDLGLSPLAQPRAQLFAAHFDPEIVSAAEHLSSVLGRDRLALGRYRPLRHQGQLSVLLEPLKPGPAAEFAASRSPDDEPVEVRGPRLTDPPSPSAFRTGLTDADLRIQSAG